MEQGKNVFCIPHNLETKNGVGNNRLIQEGAKLVTCVEDILIEYKNLNIKKSNIENHIIKREVKEEYRAVYNEIGNTEISINNLCKKLNCPIGDLNYLITMMELENLIQVLPGNKIKRK